MVGTRFVVLCVICGSALAQDWKTVRNGIEHAKVRREFSGRPVDVNLLRLDLKKVRLDVQRADDRALGTETTSSIAARHRAVAAINAGFFRLDESPFRGDSVGLFMIDGELISEPTNDRIQLLINNRPTETQAFITRSVLSHSFRLGDETLPVTGINRERNADDLIVYTPRFGRTTLTTADGVELVIVKGNIYSISLGVGNSVIPSNGYVISASGSYRDSISRIARKTAVVTLVQHWDGLPLLVLADRSKLDIVTGVPQLIRNGRIDITWEQEKASRSFVETRHPRTAVAKLKDGTFLMLTADGRSETSAGLDLFDLASYLLELGAVEAMNLDGGGSTTMYLEGTVVNRPSDAAGERKVSDAIIVTLRPPVRPRRS